MYSCFVWFVGSLWYIIIIGCVWYDGVLVDVVGDGRWCVCLGGVVVVVVMCCWCFGGGVLVMMGIGLMLFLCVLCCVFVMMWFM